MTCPPLCPYSTQTPILCSGVLRGPVVHDERAGASAGTHYGDNHFCTACRRSFYADCGKADKHYCRDQHGETTCDLNPDCYSCELGIDHCHGPQLNGESKIR